MCLLSGTAEPGGWRVGSWEGLSTSTFLEEKCFWLSIRYMLEALEVPVILHLIQVEFPLEKYLIVNVENTISEPLRFKLFWGGCSQNPRPLCTLPNKPLRCEFSSPPPTAIEIALRRPCVYSHPLPSEKKRSKGGSFENKALENEVWSTKLPKLETPVSWRTTALSLAWCKPNQVEAMDSSAPPKVHKCIPRSHFKAPL